MVEELGTAFMLSITIIFLGAILSVVVNVAAMCFAYGRQLADPVVSAMELAVLTNPEQLTPGEVWTGPAAFKYITSIKDNYEIDIKVGANTVHVPTDNSVYCLITQYPQYSFTMSATWVGTHWLFTLTAL